MRRTATNRARKSSSSNCRVGAGMRFTKSSSGGSGTSSASGEAPRRLAGGGKLESVSAARSCARKAASSTDVGPTGASSSAEIASVSEATGLPSPPFASSRSGSPVSEFPSRDVPPTLSPASTAALSSVVFSFFLSRRREGLRPRQLFPESDCQWRAPGWPPLPSTA